VRGLSVCDDEKHAKGEKKKSSRMDYSRKKWIENELFEKMNEIHWSGPGAWGGDWINRARSVRKPKKRLSVCAAGFSGGLSSQFCENRKN
jgi:hypothetical protein